MTIIVSKDGEQTTKIEQSSFELEDELQNYIHNNPESIPIYEIKEDKTLFVAAREFPTNSGPIDALAFDADGEIYVVETKLYKNPDKRTVVAQALDYGAALWKHFNDFSYFLEILDKETFKKFNERFRDKLIDFFSMDETQFDEWQDRVRANLNEGNLKFVILMNAMSERLKDLIIYVNQNSSFDIYAVQFSYYQYEKLEIIIPKLFGVEVKKNIKTYSKGTQWRKETFLEYMEKTIGATEAKISEEIIDWCESKKIYAKWGSGKKHAGVNFILRKAGHENNLFSISTEAGGSFWAQFNYYSKQPPFDSLELQKSLRERLNSIEGVSISEDVLGAQKYPSYKLAYLKERKEFDKFIDTIEWMLMKVEESR